jgi:predicted nucleic acid-binding protein
MDERNNLAIHAVNLCEVYYGYLQSDGLDKANEAWENASMLLGILGIPPEAMTEDFVKRVGRWKAQKKLGLGDSFLAATAEEYAAVLVTADHDDFDPIQQTGLIQIDFIR